MGFIQSLAGKMNSVSPSTSKSKLDMQIASALLLVTCAMFILDTIDLFVAVAGAGCYLLLKFTNGKTARKKTFPCKEVSYDDEVVAPQQYCQKQQARQGNPSSPYAAAARKDASRQSSDVVVTPKIDYRQPSVAPVAPPKFSNAGWEKQVQELMRQIEPTSSSIAMVRGIERIVQQAIRSIIPEAEVTGYSSANPLGAKAFGVAVPEVDVVVNASEEVLRRRLSCGRIDSRQVLKAALRSCTEALVSHTGLKFRRSAFQTDEPKIILLVPTALGVAEEAFGINVSVNASSPSRSQALFDECAGLEPRAKELILLVRRWARDRGISHAAKGTLPPSVWTLLTIYFLQVGVPEEGPLLPPMTTHDGVLKKRKRLTPQLIEAKTCGTLFKDFIDFFHSEFDWNSEVISVREGNRSSAKVRRALPVVVDPFDAEAKPAACLTSAGLARVQEEFARAQKLCLSLESASLTELLEPWAPPEMDPAIADKQHENQEFKNSGRDRGWRSNIWKGDSDVPKTSAALLGKLSGAATPSLRPGGSLTRPGLLTGTSVSLRPGGAAKTPVSA
eukprot:TRINITY_DN1951_c0_g1_i1.p1 TRINITY_DN1951_c0_g1~~TRINITY_DN1951_c0_g1_i1.p1  ORF type:complete len:592 (-),score=109.06 TRINITY_DN1951_c0_g1_i1:104-1783(-)